MILFLYTKESLGKKVIKLNKKETVFILVALFWIAYLIRSVLMNEWGIDFSIVIFWRISALIQFATIVIILGSLGTKIVRWFNVTDREGINLCYGIGLGVGLFSFYMFFCGMIGFLRAEAVLMFFGIALIFSLREIIGFFKLLKNLFIFEKTENDLFLKMMRGSFYVTVALYVVGAFCPVLNYDALEYHLGIPDLYVKAGAIFFMPYHHFSHYPMNMEMFYLASLILDKTDFIVLFNSLFVFLTGLLIGEYTRKYWNIKAAWLAMLLYVCSNHLLMISLGKPDVGLVFYCTAAILLFLNRGIKDMMFGGVFAGLALGSKYTAFVYVWTSLGVLWMIILLSEKDRKKMLASFAAFIAISILVAAPWWLKNYIETGDPLFPLGYPFFKSTIWSLDQYQDLWAYYDALSLSKRMGIWESMSRMIVESKTFWPAFYLGLPLVILGLKERKIRSLFIYFIIGYILTFYKTTGHTRFFIPIYPVLCIAIAASFSIKNGFLLGKKMIGIGIGLFIFWNLGAMALGLENIEAPKRFLGLMDEATLLKSKLPPYAAIDFLNKTMSPGEKVLFVGEARTFYLKEWAVATSPHDRAGVIYFIEGAKDNSGILKRFNNQGINYLFVNFSEMQRLDRSVPKWGKGIDWQRLKAFLDEYGVVIYSNQRPRMLVYRVGKTK